MSTLYPTSVYTFDELKLLLDKGFEELYYHKGIKTYEHVRDLEYFSEKFMYIIRLYTSFPNIKNARGVNDAIKKHYTKLKDIYVMHFFKLYHTIRLTNTVQVLSPILNPESILMKRLGKDIVVDILATHFGHELGHTVPVKQLGHPYKKVIKLLNDLVLIKSRHSSLVDEEEVD